MSRVQNAEARKCPECAAGKCGNCTGETLVACQCTHPTLKVSLLEQKERVLRFVEATGTVGATVPEIQAAHGTVGLRGVVRVGSRLRILANEGSAVRLVERRGNWPVWVAIGDVQGREIASSQADDIEEQRAIKGHQQEGTDMTDEQQDDDRGGLTVEQDRRVTALYHAKSVLPESREVRGALQGPSIRQPAPKDLIVLAEYIVNGVDTDG